MARTAAKTRDLMASAQPATVAKAAEATVQPVVKDVTGLRSYAALVEATKHLDAIKLLQLIPLQKRILGHFVSKGRSGKTPPNWQALDGEASASMQLRRKGSNQPLAPEVVQLLIGAGIPVAPYFVTRRTFIVNPDYADDTKLITAAGKALGAAGLPDDFIQLQEEVSYDVVAENSIDTIFERYGATDPKRAALLLEACGFVICQPTWNGDPQNAVDLARQEFLEDAMLAPADKAVVRAKAIERERERSRYRPGQAR